RPRPRLLAVKDPSGKKTAPTNAMMSRKPGEQPIDVRPSVIAPGPGKLSRDCVATARAAMRGAATTRRKNVATVLATTIRPHRGVTASGVDRLVRAFRRLRSVTGS